MFLFKLILLVSAFGALPVSMRYGPVSLSALLTVTILLLSAIIFAYAPSIPRATISAIVFLGLFCFLNLIMICLLPKALNTARLDLFIWSGFLLVLLIAIARTCSRVIQLINIARFIDLIAIIYIFVLIVILYKYHQDAPSTQFGVLLYSYYLAKFYDGDKRSLFFLAVIPCLQLLLLSRIVIVAELFILVLGNVLITDFNIPSHRQFLKSNFLAFVIGVIIIIGSYFSGIFEKTTQGDSAFMIGDLAINSSGRFYWWQIIFESFLDSPWFGHGLPGPPEMLETERWSHPHNDYLRILHQTGLVGLSLWISFIFQVLIMCRRAVQMYSPRTIERQWCHTALMSCIGLSVVMITDNSLVYSYVMFPFAIFIGIGIGLHSRVN